MYKAACENKCTAEKTHELLRGACTWDEEKNFINNWLMLHLLVSVILTTLLALELTQRIAKPSLHENKNIGEKCCNSLHNN